MVESIRKNERSVLLLDAGNVFDRERDAAELSLKSMALMGYDALNLTSSEFNFGVEFLDQARTQVPFPYISSNLLFEGRQPPWIHEYIVREIGGIKVAVLGLFDTPDFTGQQNREALKGWTVTPPEAALKRLLPEVRGKADLVVLLSGLGTRETEALVKTATGIDVAISSGNNDPLLGGTPKETILLDSGYHGQQLGLLKVKFDEKQKPIVTGDRHILLGQDVPENGEIAGLITAFKKNREKEAADLAIEKARQKEKQHQEYMDGLKLSPQEFMERLKQEQGKS